MPEREANALILPLRQWGLTLESPPRRTPAGWVAMVRRGADQFMLKQPLAHDELRAWQVLAHYDGDGAVRLIDHLPNGTVLLERAVPGTPLTQWVLDGNDEGALAILCGIAARLHRHAAPAADFPAIEDWGRGFARHRSTRAAGIPAALLDRAEMLFAALASSQGTRRLLHGDLHHDNVLFDRRRGWLSIDPKGVLGEPAYEFGAALRNPTEDVRHFAGPAIAARRAAIIERELGLDRQRVLDWAFAQAVLSAIWSLEDGQDPVRGLATAQALVPLVRQR